MYVTNARTGDGWCPDVKELGYCGIQGQTLALKVLMDWQNVVFKTCQRSFRILVSYIKCSIISIELGCGGLDTAWQRSGIQREKYRTEDRPLWDTSSGRVGLAWRELGAHNLLCPAAEVTSKPGQYCFPESSVKELRNKVAMMYTVNTLLM